MLRELHAKREKPISGAIVNIYLYKIGGDMVKAILNHQENAIAVDLPVTEQTRHIIPACGMICRMR